MTVLSSVRNLGDSFFFHLRSKFKSFEDMEKVHAFRSSRLDYFNVLYLAAHESGQIMFLII